MQKENIKAKKDIIAGNKLEIRKNIMCYSDMSILINKKVD